MFEPQDHPNDFAYPGGPPIPPYDATGWTLAFQMGVEFHRILEGFDGPFRVVEDTLSVSAAPVFTPFGDEPAGYLLSHEVNNAFTAVYRLLGQGVEVFWLAGATDVGNITHPAGTFWIPASDVAKAQAGELARELGVQFIGVQEEPRSSAMRLSRPRIGLWDRYGGSMPSGWVRFILDQFGMDFELVFAQELDAGNLREKFDVLIFPDGAIPSIRSAGGERYGRGGGGPDPETIPGEFRDRLGSVTAEATLPRIREFLEAGGTVVALEGSTDLAYHLGLPVEDFLVDEDGMPLRSEEFYVPGSLLEVRVRGERPVTHGVSDPLIVNFARSPVFGVEDGARDVQILAAYEDDTPLRSGWAWGQEKLEGGSAFLEASVGDGTLFLFGPQITYRGQTHANFPLLFNSILLSTAEDLGDL
jgi:hypothetical protein